ncbi:hypothetical protein ACMFMG_001640 [Clarireedia jacksonii]
MHFNFLAITSLLAVASATAELKQPYKLAAKSVNQAFGFSKRQAGYQPSQTFCSGSGTCAEACGTGYETCPSTDGGHHCFNPTASESCCPTGTGDSCSEGYYCTQATDLTVWCCPDGMDLVSCAAIYSLTGSLQSIGASTPAPVSSTPAPVFSTLSPIPPIRTTAADVTTTSVKSSTTVTPISTVSPTKSGNGTITATSSSIPFTGMAAGRGDIWVAGSVLVVAVGWGLLL